MVLHTTITVRPPEYLNIPESKVALNIGEITAVEGSKLSFNLETSSPLKKGTFGPTEISGELVKENEFQSINGPLKITGVEASFGPIITGHTPFSIPFSWIDEFDLIGGESFKIRVDAVKDAPPVAYLQGLDRQKAIVPKEVLDFEILGEDDFESEKLGSSGAVTAPIQAKNRRPAAKSSLLKAGRKSIASANPLHFHLLPSGSLRNDLFCALSWKTIFQKEVGFIRNPL